MEVSCEYLTAFVSPLAVIFTSLVAFVLPLVLAHHVVREYDYKGSIPVYFGKITDKASELLSLKILLAVAMLSILLALLGNIIS